MKNTLLALALTTVSASAAADALIYGSTSIGKATLNGSSSTSYNFNVGTGILPFVGLEAGLQKYDGFNGVRYDGAVRDLEGTSIYFAAKPSINVGPVGLYGKAGVHAYELKSKSNDGFKEDDIGLLYGVGVEYAMLRNLSVGAAYNVHSFENDDVENLSFSATFHF